MKRITVTCFYLLLFPTIYLAGLFTGGVSESFAQEYQAFQEKNIYEVTIENTTSKVVSKMFVYAYTAEQAGEQVYLNGWKVLGVKLSEEKPFKEYEFSADTVNSITPRQVQIDSELKNNPLPNAGALNATLASRKVGGAVGRNADGGLQVADNLGLLPDSEKLEIMRTVFFPFGVIKPIQGSEGIAQLKSLSTERKYIVFGHADEVPVAPNSEYGSNYELSFKRAEAIKAIMVQNGIPSENIDIVGLGSSYPADRSGPANNVLNRRTEVYGFRTQD